MSEDFTATEAVITEAITAYIMAEEWILIFSVQPNSKCSQRDFLECQNKHAKFQ